MTESAYQIYVGIDSGSQRHQVVVLAAESGERVVTHDGAALHAMAQWVAGLGPPGAVAVAIEVPHGAVVDTLLEHGVHVYHRLRTYGGVAPVTRQSGTRRRVHMRYACSQRLRNALYYRAFIAARHDPATRQHYAALRARGQSQGRALRSVVDRLLRILIAMLTTPKRSTTPRNGGYRLSLDRDLDNGWGIRLTLSLPAELA